MEPIATSGGRGAHLSVGLASRESNRYWRRQRSSEPTLDFLNLASPRPRPRVITWPRWLAWWLVYVRFVCAPSLAARTIAPNPGRSPQEAGGPVGGQLSRRLSSLASVAEIRAAHTRPRQLRLNLMDFLASSTRRQLIRAETCAGQLMGRADCRLGHATLALGSRGPFFTIDYIIIGRELRAAGQIQWRPIEATT